MQVKKLVSKILPKRFQKSITVIPVVRLKGVISANSTPLNQSLSLASAAPLLEKAFSDKQAPAIAIAVNSPGGSPVQSRLIYKRIRDLAAEHKKEVLVFTEDAAASGGYMIACAGDEIIADPSSIVGSIGVISSGFGFVDAIKKLGVERRVYTAGGNKSTLDPFKPEKKADVDRIKKLQLDIHDVFINLVKESRGDKLADKKDLFTGEFWAGQEALELGLVDHIGDMRSFLKARFGDKTEMKLVAAPRGLFGRRAAAAGIDQLVNLAMAEQIVDRVISAADERALWSRLGL